MQCSRNTVGSYRFVFLFESLDLCMVKKIPKNLCIPLSIVKKLHTRELNLIACLAMQIFPNVLPSFLHFMAFCRPLRHVAKIWVYLVYLDYRYQSVKNGTIHHMTLLVINSPLILLLFMMLQGFLEPEMAYSATDWHQLLQLFDLLIVSMKIA